MSGGTLAPSDSSNAMSAGLSFMPILSSGLLSLKSTGLKDSEVAGLDEVHGELPICQVGINASRER